MDQIGRDAAVPAATAFVQVSPEMTVLFGGGVAGAPIPHAAAALVFVLGGRGIPATLRVRPVAGAVAEEERGALMLLVAAAALSRLFGDVAAAAKDGCFHLTTELRAICVAVRDCPMQGDALRAYRGAKSIELLCEAMRLLGEGGLTPAAHDAELSREDSARVVAARRMIEERCHEKLTLERIARACGLNRSKLTRGFRQMFECTVAEAIADGRLARASRMLLTTDLPVSSVGYQAGYLNNASFARAFGRRFGVPPSDYRACRLAA
jgi:AraC family transcriptional activator of pyochelin receptor